MIDDVAHVHRHLLVEPVPQGLLVLVCHHHLHHQCHRAVIEQVVAQSTSVYEDVAHHLLMKHIDSQHALTDRNCVVYFVGTIVTIVCFWFANGSNNDGIL